MTFPGYQNSLMGKECQLLLMYVKGIFLPRAVQTDSALSFGLNELYHDQELFGTFEIAGHHGYSAACVCGLGAAADVYEEDVSS